MRLTPETFKEQLQQSCVFNPTMNKKDMQASLEETEGLQLMSMNSSEILSRFYRDLCPQCHSLLLVQTPLPIPIPNPSSKVQGQRLAQTMAGSTKARPLAGDSGLQDMQRADLVDVVPRGTIRSGSCKWCKKEIPQTLIIEIVNQMADALFNQHPVLRIDEEPKILQAITQTPNAKTILLVAEKSPALLQSNVDTCI